MNSIEFKNVSKSYKLYYNVSYKDLFFNLFRRKKICVNKKFTALNNISFSIKKGETVGVIGRNGSGKSTVLGLIAGVIKPNHGIVNVSQRVSPLLELGGGFHPELNAYENIELNGVLLGISLQKIRLQMNEIIDFSELSEFADQPIRTYSSGMLARLGFSIVTQLQPELLLIDEVLAVGDAAFRQKCINRMLDFKKEGVSIVFVSHNPSDIEILCDRVIWIENHQIKMDGQTDLILKEYNKQ